MIQHYLCQVTLRRTDNAEVLSIGHCDVWARGVNDAKERAALDPRSSLDNHVFSIPNELVEREIIVEEEIIPGPDEVMYLPGYDSGNMECWTYDVNAWDFERVTGRAPDAGEGSWDNVSILEGLSEPHWQLGMDDILKWAGGRPIKLEAKKVPPIRDPQAPAVYTGDQMNRRCMTSVYLCTGVLDYIEEHKVDCVESPGGSEFITAICDRAQAIDDWLEDNHIDVEELTDGYYLYEVVEEELGEKVVLHAIANDGDLPSRKEIIAMLQDIHTRRLKENEPA